MFVFMGIHGSNNFNAKRPCLICGENCEGEKSFVAVKRDGPADLIHTDCAVEMVKWMMGDADNKTKQ